MKIVKKLQDTLLPLKYPNGFYWLAYRRNWFFYWKADILLQQLDETKSYSSHDLPREILTNNDYNEVVDFLVENGYLSQDRSYTFITQNGHLFVQGGGYLNRATRIIIRAIVVIVGVLGGLAAIIGTLWQVFHKGA